MGRYEVRPGVGGRWSDRRRVATKEEAIEIALQMFGVKSVDVVDIETMRVVATIIPNRPLGVA